MGSTLALAQTAAPAAEAKAPYTLTGNVALTNEYRYRGISQTNKMPALQGGFDFAHDSGFYLGTWGSNVSWLSDQSSLPAPAPRINNSLELDVYGGYKGTAGDLGYDVGLLQYIYPGSYPSAFVKPNTLEIYAAATYKMFVLKYSRSTTNLFGFAESKGSGYLDLTGTYELAEGLNLVGHVGRQTVKNNKPCDYTDYKLGVTKDFAGLSWGLSYIDTDAKGSKGECYANAFNKDLGKGTALVSVGKTF